MGELTRFELPERFPVRVAGQVPDFDASPYPFLSGRAMAHWSSPVFAHSLLVVHRALSRAGIEVDEGLSPRVAVTFSTAIGGLDAVLAADRRMQSTGKLPLPFVNPNSCVNMVAGKVGILANATGPNVTTVAACATGSTSVITGAMLIESGQADLAICGAVDFPLVEPIVAGFATMNGAYKPKRGAAPEPPVRASRPFAADRRGFVVSEGAGCILLASPDFARSHGLEARVALAGWALNSDAYHVVAPKRETIAACMRQALGHAGVGPGDVQAVNAHAASTKAGDQTEAAALSDVFGDGQPPVSANKSQLGHAMGASSAIEGILAMESLLRGQVLPTLNYTPDPSFELDCVADGPRAVAQEHVLKNAFGFGGTNACVVYRRLT